MGVFVIDTGPLSHAAQAGVLDVLERLFHGQECYFPPQVYEELRVHEPSTPALEAGWARLAALSVEGELRTIYFKSLLGGSGRKNLGEAQCIALAEELGGAVYLDDGDGRDVAEAENVMAMTTTEFLEACVRSQRIKKQEAASFIDSLLATGYRGLDVPSGKAFLKAYALNQLPDR